MSLAEITPHDTEMSEASAREITDLIARTGSILWGQVVRAYQGRAWSALGYSSWDEYCEAEFDGARIKLPREERSMVVASLADAGMSTRAIAAATGVSKSTIATDIAGVQNWTPDPDDDVIDAEVVEMVTDGKVTGTDGKTYTLKPKPQARRQSIAPDIDQAASSLHRAVERLERLRSDDRFDGAITPYLASVIEHAIGVLTEITNNKGNNQ